jgi:hypothetical protein
MLTAVVLYASMCTVPIRCATAGDFGLSTTWTPKAAAAATEANSEQNNTTSRCDAPVYGDSPLEDSMALALFSSDVSEHISSHVSSRGTNGDVHGCATSSAAAAAAATDGATATAVSPWHTSGVGTASYAR